MCAGARITNAGRDLVIERGPCCPFCPPVRWSRTGTVLFRCRRIDARGRSGVVPDRGMASLAMHQRPHGRIPAGTYDAIGRAVVVADPGCTPRPRVRWCASRLSMSSAETGASTAGRCLCVRRGRAADVSFAPYGHRVRRVPEAVMIAVVGIVGLVGIGTLDQFSWRLADY